ncbi:hypothetical protein T08_5774 [Trichinella sp. T8]|uniref:Uncharacterized protein n=2 Tax=Trichinella TaxID=6333 RepID=A0A0V0TCH9_9BILA|nr:hypothetical protein T05_13945 [Trichinella murrelli]KRZ87356.1 hypothetical protein T08_5774 [Trichinella sp. T8]
MLVLVRAHFLDRSVTPVAADVDLSSEVHHQSRIAYIGIGFERWFIQILKISQISRSRRFKKIMQSAVIIKKSMSTTNVTNIIHNHIHFHVHVKI